MTGRLIGICTAAKFAPALQLTRAITLLSGCAVPICEVPEVLSSILPAAALAQVRERFRRVWRPWIWIVAVAVPPGISTTYALAIRQDWARGASPASQKS